MNNSRIIIGCMSWGLWGKKWAVQEQAAMIDFCVQQGNTSFDHADIYGDYTTEADFGKALKECKLDRSRIRLISKCGIKLKGTKRKYPLKYYDYAKDYIIWSAEESLRQLQTDYLDTFLLHRPSPLMQVDEIAEAAHYLLQSGKIKSFGVSNFTPSQVEILRKQVDIAVNQIEFSLTNSMAMNDGTLDYHRMHAIYTMSWSPLGTVFKVDTKQTQRIKNHLLRLTEKYDCAASSILLNWILKHPASISPVIGTTNKERIIQANEALNFTLTDVDWFALLESSRGREVA